LCERRLKCTHFTLKEGILSSKSSNIGAEKAECDLAAELIKKYTIDANILLNKIEILNHEKKSFISEPNKVSAMVSIKCSIMYAIIKIVMRNLNTGTRTKPAATYKSIKYSIINTFSKPSTWKKNVITRTMSRLKCW